MFSKKSVKFVKSKPARFSVANLNNPVKICTILFFIMCSFYLLFFSVVLFTFTISKNTGKSAQKKGILGENQINVRTHLFFFHPVDGRGGSEWEVQTPRRVKYCDSDELKLF